MIVGILIPTRGDRPKFLEHALWLISQQSMQPDLIEVVADPPKGQKKDITLRYKLGCERLFSKGADIIIFWEDDDYYSHLYIQKMVSQYVKHKKPDIFGIDSTIYYHLKTRKYALLPSNPKGKKASAMATIVNRKIMDIEWPPMDYVWFDIWIWERMAGVSIEFDEPINVGIKHGIGMTGGIGHRDGINIYKNQDRDYKFLSSLVDAKSLQFYKKLV